RTATRRIGAPSQRARTTLSLAGPYVITASPVESTAAPRRDGSGAVPAESGGALARAESGGAFASESRGTLARPASAGPAAQDTAGARAGPRHPPRTGPAGAAPRRNGSAR